MKTEMKSIYITSLVMLTALGVFVHVQVSDRDSGGEEKRTRREGMGQVNGRHVQEGER